MAKLPLLTANGRRLVLKLAELPHTWVSAAVLAQEIGVSRRTVLREMQGVEQWMSAAGFTFVRSPGQGLLLDEPPSRREELRELAQQGSDSDTLPKEARRQKLLCTLLGANVPQKTYTLANDLMVSEHTLGSDLDWVEQWCSPYQIALCRRPGVGIWLEGSASARRRAVNSLLRSTFPEQQLHAALQSGPPKMPLAGLLESDIVEKVWYALREFEEAEHSQLTDAGFLTLLVHCTLTIQQMKSDRWEPTIYTETPNLRQAEKLARRLEKACGLQLPVEEKRHLALALEAYFTRRQEEWDAPDSLALRGLASALIASVEESMKVNLSRHPTLARDLCNHLKPMLYRMKQGIAAENPQLELIQTEYSALWQATRKACDCILPEISDAEAGFLAMHLGAVIEEETLANLRVRCVVVCPYGMATGKFLASQLMREFPQLHIEQTCSVRALNSEELQRKNIDLIISTVPLERNDRQVCVNPVLQQADRTKLQSAIQTAQHRSGSRTAPTGQAQLRRAGRLSVLMLDLLDNLTIQTVSLPGNRADLIEAASQLFCTEEAKAKTIFDALWRREKLGDTYIKPLRSLLLHARVSTVPSCRLGYLRADPPVYENGKLIQGALVLLAPEIGKEPLEVMQAVSGLLIEDPDLIAALRRADRALAGTILEKGLGRQFDRVLKADRF